MAEAAAKKPEPNPRRGVTLDQVLGHEPVRRFLREAWRSGRLPQSLLLTGPAGLGKTTLAYALIREIVAEGGDPATHPRARKIERGVHPDLLELTGKDSVSAMIKVDEIRQIEERASTAPLEAPRKIVLIAPADRMNDEAANCLLKILEEPPRSLLFLLVTAEPNRVLETIRSRCTVLRLDPVPTAELTDWLVAEGRLEPDKARLVALLAEGRPGFALALAKGGLLEARGDILEALNFLMQNGFAGIYQVAQRFLSAKAGLEAALTIALTLLRDALVLKTRGTGLLNQDLAEPLAAFARERPLDGLLEAGRRFEAAAAELPYFYSPQAKAHFVECLVIEVGRLLRG